jgi:hypothetical protein
VAMGSGGRRGEGRIRSSLARSDLGLTAARLAACVPGGGASLGAAWQAAEVTSTGSAEVVCQAGDGRPCLRRGGCGGEGGG